MDAPTVVTLNGITIHEIKDKAQLEALMQQGEIKQGDICFIQETGNIIQVDDALSDESENPVQNKVINAALNEKLAKSNIAKCSDIDKLF